jgi:hypothetical protein
MEILRILWEPKVQCCVQKNLPLIIVLSQINPSTCFRKSHFNIILHSKTSSYEWSLRAFQPHFLRISYVPRAYSSLHRFWPLTLGEPSMRTTERRKEGRRQLSLLLPPPPFLPYPSSKLLVRKTRSEVPVQTFQRPKTLALAILCALPPLTSCSLI